MRVIPKPVKSSKNKRLNNVKSIIIMITITTRYRVRSIQAESNISFLDQRCNVIIPRPVDHGLHLIQPRLNLLFTASAISSSLYGLIVATTSSPSYRLGHTSALVLSGTEVPCVACEPKQFALIVGSRRLLANQRLFRHGQA